MKTFQYRIYPTKKQASTLRKWLRISCDLYNSLLEERKKLWETEKKTIGLYDQIKEIPKRKAENPIFKEVHSTVLQNVAVRLDLAYQAFFRRCKNGEKPGHPRFKGKGHYDSVTFVQFGNGISLTGNVLKVSKIGDVKVTLHRSLMGKPKTAIIKRDSVGKWFVNISCDMSEVPVPRARNYGDAVGIDLGVTTFATLSSGETIENPRFFEQNQKALAKAQRQIALLRNAKKKVAKRIYRKRAKIHSRIKNCRKDFTRKISAKLANNYSIICVEDLKINQLVEKNWINKQIYDVAWRQFLDQLENKAVNAGCQVIKVNPAYSSQDCSACGTRVLKDLKERTHDCPSCGLSIDRDLNASKNILRVGLHSLAKA